MAAAVREPLIRGCFLALARSGDADGARQFASDLLRETAPDARAGMLDALATTTLLADLRGFLPDADAWTQELLALEPDKITRQGTRGGVLVELGRSEEGEAMLRKVWRTSRNGNDAAIGAFYLGIAARNRGRKGDLRYWRKRALDFRAVLSKEFTARVRTELVLAPLPTRPVASPSPVPP